MLRTATCVALGAALASPIATTFGTPGASAGGISGAVVEHPSATHTLFEIHSSFWLNLHHFLYEQAVFSAGDSTRRMSRHATRASLDGLPEAERRIWDEALAFYRDSLIERSLLFNRRLGQLDRELWSLGAAPGVAGRLSSSALEPVLEAAAPVYAARWWPEHDAANREYIASLEPLLERFGDAIAADVETILHEAWPDEAVRVEIVEYANWAGAYTRTEPTRIVISSTEGVGDELGSLETVFHEAAHGMLGRTHGAVAEATRRAFTRAGKEPPASLWHPLLFFTVGEIVGRHLAKYGIEGYMPYADRHGLYTGEWREPHRLLSLYWPAYLDGQTTLDAALEKIAAAW
jgi:hypothetical protein